MMDDLLGLCWNSLLVDMQPPVNPPKMIDDPEDKKPEDWVSRTRVVKW